MAPDESQSLDYLLVGGGLGNALIALAVLDAQPSARVGLVEQQTALGGNHTWCFHAGDVDAAHRYVAPLVTARWPCYDVRFPDLGRTLDEPYAAVSSERLHEVVASAFAARPTSRLLLGSRAARVTASTVSLDSGEQLRAKVVIESRGPEAYTTAANAGYQKFLGLELKLRRPCPIEHPVLMDALLSQEAGFRFMYALPLAPDRVLLEDTYFSDSSELDQEQLRGQVLSYAESHGFEVEQVLREEVGVLPLPKRLPRLSTPTGDEPLLAGYQGGWFHPVTGYSFPVAARVASAVAHADVEQLRPRVWPELQRAQQAQLRFCILLNRMFFDAFAPEARRNVIERFYRLKPELVRRFYALSMTRADRARIVCGRPPRGFSISRALSGASRSLPPSSMSPSTGVPS